MLETVQFYIQQQNLSNSGTPILVACSGGIDSMVLINVLQKLNYTIAIAHCNFQLRFEESNEDEKFIEQYANENSIPFHVIKFDTKALKKEKNISTQMAARELRYEWFEQIRKENHYHKIAVAHHLDDQIETILLNLSKGTGIQGLAGMQAKNEFIIRPMLEISRQQIINYASENNIEYREDSSNASDDYQRNKLRHHVLPILKEINPDLSNTMRAFIERMNDYQVLNAEYIEQIKKKCYTEKEGIVEIKLGFIKSHSAGKTILYHLTKNMGIHADMLQKIIAVKESGKQFITDTHRLIVDRKSLFITNKENENEQHLLFTEIPKQFCFNQYKIQCSLVPIQELNIKTSPRYAYFDADKIEFPLLLRKAKEGDYFYPFGMSKSKTPGKVGKKKLSKYFKDEKFSLLDKEHAAVLFSGEKLIWLINHRTDDRFKVTPSTKRILKMVVVDSDN